MVFNPFTVKASRIYPASSMDRALQNAHLLKNYGSWIYCDSCNKTVAYLCYVNYDYFKLAEPHFGSE